MYAVPLHSGSVTWWSRDDHETYVDRSRPLPALHSPGAPVAEGGARARPPRPHGRSACRARRGTRAAPRSRVRSSSGRVEVMTPHGPRDALRLPSRRPGRAPRRTGPRKTSQCVVHRLRRAGGPICGSLCHTGRLHCSVVARAASRVLVRSAHPPRHRLSWCSIPANRGPRTRSRRCRARPPDVVAVGARSVARRDMRNITDKGDEAGSWSGFHL